MTTRQSSVSWLPSSSPSKDEVMASSGQHESSSKPSTGPAKSSRFSSVPWKRVYVVFIIGIRKGVDGMFTFVSNFIFREQHFSSVCVGAASRVASDSAVSTSVRASDVSGDLCLDCPNHVLREIHFSMLSTSLSARAEYKLVCEKDYLAAAALSAYMLGMAVGATVTGRLVSPYGRLFFGRYASTTAIVLPVLLMAVTNSVSIMIACMLVLGAGVGIGVIANYLILIELFADSPVWRARGTMVVFVVWSFVVFLIAPMAYLMDSFVPHLRRSSSSSYIMRALEGMLPSIQYADGDVTVISSWRTLLLAMILVEVIANYFYFLKVPESAVWLKSVGRMRDYLRVVRSLGMTTSGCSHAALLPNPRAMDGPVQTNASPMGEVCDAYDEDDEFANETSSLLSTEPSKAQGAAGHNPPGSDDGDDDDDDDDNDNDNDENEMRTAASGFDRGTLSSGRSNSKTQCAADARSYWLLFSYSVRHHNRPILALTALSLCSWFAIAMTYYGMILNAGMFGPSLYIGVGISALEQSIGYWIADPMMNSRLLGRRYTMALCFLVSMFCFWGMAFISFATGGEQTMLTNVLALVCMLFISCAFGVIYPYTAELFPLHIRGDGLGLGLVYSRIGSILAPVLIQLTRHGDASEDTTGMSSVSGIMFGLACFLAAASNLMLPETRDHNLADDVGSDDTVTEKQGAGD